MMSLFVYPKYRTNMLLNQFDFGNDLRFCQPANTLICYIMFRGEVTDAIYS
jgi:hypothetical protein